MARFLKWEQTAERFDCRPQYRCKQGLQQGQQAACFWRENLVSASGIKREGWVKEGRSQGRAGGMGSRPLTRFMPPRGVPPAAFFSAQAAPGRTAVFVAMLRPILEKKASGPVLMRLRANCAGGGNHAEERVPAACYCHKRGQPHLPELHFIKPLISIRIKNCHSRLNGKCRPGSAVRNDLCTVPYSGSAYNS